MVTQGLPKAFLNAAIRFQASQTPVCLTVSFPRISMSVISPALLSIVAVLFVLAWLFS